MTNENLRDEWFCARNKLKKAESAAGIEQLSEELNHRSRLVASADPDYRQIVFAVPDLELRRQLIHYNRECHRLCRADAEDELEKLEAHLRNDGEHFRRKALSLGVLSAIVAILLGNYYWGVTGGLIFAVTFLLIGFDGILRADRAAIVDIEKTKEEIRQQDDFLSKLGKEGDFSLEEETTGTPIENMTSASTGQRHAALSGVCRTGSIH